VEDFRRLILVLSVSKLADDYFEAKSSPFDHFPAEEEVGEKSDGLGNVIDSNKGMIRYCQGNMTDPIENVYSRLIFFPAVCWKNPIMFTRALTLKSVVTVLLGGGYSKSQLPLTVAAVTNESYAEKDIPFPRETDTKNLEAGGFPVKSVNPFSKAALRGTITSKQYTGKLLSHEIRRVAIQRTTNATVMILTYILMAVRRRPYQLVSHLVVA